MTKQPKVVIEKTEDGIAWTDPAGKRETFEQPIRTLWLEVQELKAVKTLNWMLTTENPDLPLELSVQGQAILEDRGIEVIGYPNTRTRTLTIGFHPLRPDHPKRPSGGLQSAMVGFSLGDWEIGDDDQWWISIYLSPIQLSDLLQAFHAGQIRKLTLGLDLSGAYVTEKYTPPSARLYWYIPPDESLAGHSKTASGALTVMNIETATINLRQPNPTDEPDPSDDSEVPPTPQDRLGPTIEALTAKLGGIHKSLSFIFWALVVLVAVSMFKGH